jgi:N-sulfoglucosamine sulfohydrolase
MNRRKFATSLSAATAPLFAQAGALKPAASKARNVVFMIADDLGLQLSAYQDPNIRTPNIDRLAQRGVRFENAFCTTASCSPSRSVMLTGLQNHANGQYGLGHGKHTFWMAPEIQPLPNLLKAAGYRTGVFGKLHVNAPKGMQWDVENAINGRNGVAMQPSVRQFIEDSKDKPFYLHVGFTDPHRSPNDFDNRAFPGIERKIFDPAKLSLPSFVPDNAAARQDTANYYEAVDRLDQGVGAMLRLLEDTQRLDNTLIVFLSDNGMPFPGAKTSVYDAATKLPLLVSAPGMDKPGMVSKALASWVDFVPTVLDWTSAASPKYPLHGRSWLPILKQPEPTGWDRAFFSHTHHEITNYYPMRSVRTPQYRYIRNVMHQLQFPVAGDLFNSLTWQSIKNDPTARLGKRTVKDFLHRPAEELYDVTTDPDEVINLAGDTKHREVLLRLRKEVRDFRAKTGDLLLQFEENQLPPLP